MGFEGDDVPDEAVVDTCARSAHRPWARSARRLKRRREARIDSVSRTADAVDADGAWQFACRAARRRPSPWVASWSPAQRGRATAGCCRRAGLCCGTGSIDGGSNLDLLLDIELPLSVRFGQAELTLQHLTRLGPGSVIDLHRSADEPVEVLVSGKVIARGEVVVVEGNYGVRVTEVVSTADRIRSLGA